LSTPLPSSLAPIKPANPGSPGKMANKTERGMYVVVNAVIVIWKKHGMHLTNWCKKTSLL